MTSKEVFEKYKDYTHPYPGFEGKTLERVYVDNPEWYEWFRNHPTMKEGVHVESSPLWWFTMAANNELEDD